MAAIALALSFAPSLMRRTGKEQVLVSVASAALGGAAGWATETVVVQLSRRFVHGEAAARLAIAGAGAGVAIARLDRSRRWAPVASAVRVAGIAALVGWVAPEKRDDGKRFDPLPLAAAGALAAAGMALRATLKRRGRRRIDFPCDAYLPSVSYGPDSLVTGLDFEGQRFVGSAMPGLPMDPVRVFVGVKSGENVAARADLAAAELERLGAFGRSRVVVCAATMRGYVNPIPIAAEEHLSGGDVAHVVVQYFDRRTPFLWRLVPRAAQTHRELMARLAARPEAFELCIYGESLGAWASQKPYEGIASLEASRVERALWVGTPYLSALARRLKREGADPRVLFLRTRDIRTEDPPGAATARFVFLERLTDPVTVFPGLEALWRRPRDMPAGVRWIPGVSFVQGLLDLVKATRWTADEPSSEGHDYRIELPLTVNVAFGHGRPRDEVARLGQEVLELEAERARRVRAARKAGSTLEGA